MAKRKTRELTPEHRKKISVSQKKRHAELRKAANQVEKGVASGQFGAQSAEYNMTVQGIRSLAKSIGPDQAYQISIDVRSAVNAIATNISKMKIRLFNSRSGKEIVKGDAYDFFNRPAPRYTQSRWLGEIAAFLCLQNEVALLRDPGQMQPRYLLPLNPSKLYIQDPTVVRDLSQINQWRYNWEDGLIAYYNADQVCFDKLFNPISNVRGISPILTGVNEIGASYEAARYNKLFFENNATPSHMLVLPEGTPRQTRLDIENRYLATFGLYEGNSHKVMVVSGGDVDIKNLDNRPKDAEFSNLMSMNTMRIAQLFKVPAIEMGIYDKTRFETADVEREMFLENTLVPLIERISDFLQDQVVDRWFGNSTAQTVESNMSKSVQKSYERALHGSNSNTVVIIDYEGTPIAAKIMRDKVAATAELRRSAGLSFNEAAEYLGLELPEPKDEVETFRDMVFINSSETRIDNLLDKPDMVPMGIMQPAAQESDDSEDEVDEVEDVEGEIEEPDEDVARSVKEFLRKYRKLAVKSADEGEMYRLSEVDSLISEHFNDSDMLSIVARLDYALLRGFVEKKDTRAVKDSFNAKDRHWIKQMAVELTKKEEKND